MATAQSANISDILTAITTQLVTVTGLDPAYVHLVASDDYTINCLEPQFIYIRPLGLNPSTNAGAGRRARPVTRVIRIYVHTRSEVDMYTDDTQALTAVDAHEDLEFKTINALDEYYPADSDGNLLTIEPLHPLPSTAPTRKAENDLGILISAFEYECVYLVPVSTPQP